MGEWRELCWSVLNFVISFKHVEREFTVEFTVDARCVKEGRLSCANVRPILQIQLHYDLCSMPSRPVSAAVDIDDPCDR